MTGPGTPTPTPFTSAVLQPAASRCLSMDVQISNTILAPAFSFLVGISHFSSSSPASLNIPSLTVVPPMSTPKQIIPVPPEFLMLLYSFVRQHESFYLLKHNIYFILSFTICSTAQLCISKYIFPLIFSYLAHLSTWSCSTGYFTFSTNFPE